MHRAVAFLVCLRGPAAYLGISRNISSTVAKMTFIDAPYDTNNIFARILRKEIPAHIVYEDEDALAFLDRFPVAEGHTLVIPKAPVKSVFEPAPGVANALARVAAALRRTYGCDLTVLSNAGPAAGQVVPHLHYHLVPRKQGDGVFTLPASRKEPLEAEEAAPLLKKLQESLAKDA